MQFLGLCAVLADGKPQTTSEILITASMLATDENALYSQTPVAKRNVYSTARILENLFLEAKVPARCCSPLTPSRKCTRFTDRGIVEMICACLSGK